MNFEEGMLVAVRRYGAFRIKGQPVRELPYYLGIIEETDPEKASPPLWKVRIPGEKILRRVSEDRMRPLLLWPLPPESQKLGPREAFDKHLPEIICALAFSVE